MLLLLETTLDVLSVRLSITFFVGALHLRFKKLEMKPNRDIEYSLIGLKAELIM